MLTGQTVCHKLLTALLLHPEYSISSEKMTVTAARSVTGGRRPIQHEDLPYDGGPTLNQHCVSFSHMLGVRSQIHHFFISQLRLNFRNVSGRNNEMILVICHIY